MNGLKCVFIRGLRVFGKKKILVLENRYLAKACSREMKKQGVDAFCGVLKFPDTLNLIAEKRPDAVLSINFHPQLAHVLRQLKIPYIAWCVDTVGNDRVFELCAQNRCSCYVFSYDANDCSRFKEAGFANVRHLCLAPDPDVFRLCDGPRRQEIDVGFVGSSLFGEAEYFKNFLKNLFFVTKRVDAPDVNTIAGEVFETVRSAPWRYNPKDLLDLVLPRAGTALAMPEGMRFGDVLTLVDKTFSAVVRQRFLADIQDKCGLRVWGDDGWDNVLGPGVCAGRVDYPDGLCPVYRNCRINLHFSKFSQSGCVPLRVLEIAASGGFVLASKTDMICREFVPGVEIEVFENSDDLADKVRYYLAHPEKREEIALNGYNKVRACADLGQRMRDILSTVFG